MIRSFLGEIGDYWYEVYEHIRGRKAQTVASCVGISWGIFIMVILVGVSNAFQDGVMDLFADFNSSMVRVDAGVVSEPSDGGMKNMQVYFEKRDVVQIRQNISDIQYISPLLSGWNRVSSVGNYGDFEIRGFDEDYLKILSIKMIRGRGLNVVDFRENRRCVIIGEQVEKVLFKQTDCIGKNILINNMPVMVVGVFKSSPTSPNDARAVMMPSTTYLSVVDKEPKFSTIVYTSKGDKDIVEQVRKQLGLLHRFVPTDQNAIYIMTLEDQLNAFDMLFSGIRYFIWFVGISTLVGGVVGISNIMVSNVRERTREIGVRIAMGATPNDIKKLILGESMAISLVAGACGIFVGWLVLNLLSQMFSGSEDLMGDLTIDVGTTIFSMFVVLLVGLFSGLRPAHLAAYMNPINALQSE